MTWRELSPEHLFDLRDPLIIDVRSPCEFAAERIPSAINVPLLDNNERAEVGTIYKVQGEIVARRLALRLISPKIPSIVDRVLELKQPGQNLIVHCWRGGLRSEAVASFLTIVGLDCWRLTGGYKAWRKFVLNQFGGNTFDFLPIVLHGRTGVGKSDILKELASRGHVVLDLEALANHRGSAFGGIGLGEQPTQKNFEAAIWMALKSVGDKPVFFEAESRKIGRLAVPDFILERITRGKKILVAGSLPHRIRRLQLEYGGSSTEDLADGLAQLERLKDQIGKTRVLEIKNMVSEDRLGDAIGLLLECHYDPMYDRHIHRLMPFDLETSSDDLGQAVASIETFVASLEVSHQLVSGNQDPARQNR